MDGAADPQAIPYGVAMEQLFWDFAGQRLLADEQFRQQLRVRFPVTDDDARRIKQLASQSFELTAAVSDDASAIYDQLCAEFVGAQPGAVNAVDLATKFQRVEIGQADQLTALYRAALAEISPQARSALEAYVDTEVRPRAMWGHDLVAVATKVPDAFLAQRKRSCERRLSQSPEEKAFKINSEYIDALQEVPDVD